MRKIMWGALLALPLVAAPAFAQDEVRNHGGAGPGQPSQAMPPSGNIDQPQFEPPQGATRADTSKEIRTGEAKLSAQDRTFVQKAATDNLAQLRMARLALDKSTDPEVKQIAQRVLADHTKAGEDLKAVADKEGITLPSDLTAEQKRSYNKLSKMSGDRFDKEYIRVVNTQHDAAVKVFDRQVNEGSDPALKDFARSTLPTLKSHKDMTMPAQEHGGTMKGPGEPMRDQMQEPSDR